MVNKPVVAVVTGASRGAGKGIAVALGSHGCIVYVTGRSENEGEAEVPGTIHATVREVTDAGGKGIAVKCDHSDDDQVKALFDQWLSRGETTRPRRSTQSARSGDARRSTVDVS